MSSQCNGSSGIVVLPIHHGYSYFPTIQVGCPASATSSNARRWDEKMLSGTVFQVSMGYNLRI
jgi:hypothetical protein